MHRRVLSHLRGNVVAYLALFFALTGVAYAAGPLKSGDPAGGDLAGTYPNPTIKQNAVGVNETTAGTEDEITDGGVDSQDVQNDSLTGDDVNESSLGTVPSATTADSAATATSADSATTAGDADTLDELDSSDFLSGYERVLGDSVFVLPGDSLIAKATAPCPEGKEPVGGGFETTGVDVLGPSNFIIHSQPVYVHRAAVDQFFDIDDLEFKNGYVAEVQFQDPPAQGEQRSVTASVICVTASTGTGP